MRDISGRKRLAVSEDIEATAIETTNKGEERPLGAQGSDAGMRTADSGRMKACPACGQQNALSRLSCMLCAAKFSVKHTAELLQERNASAVRL